MVSFKHYIFLVSLVILTACGKNEFEMEFHLSQEVTENYNVIYYATDVKGGKTVQAVASVREGICLLKGVTKRPTLVYITPRRSFLPLVVMADRGEKVEISGGGNDPLKWEVKGNEINEEFSQWREENMSVLSSQNADSVNMAVKNYVETHSAQPLSALLMLLYYDRRLDEREYTTLMASLKGKAREPRWNDLVARSDRLNPSLSYPASLNNMVMRSSNRKGDTLKIDYENPVMIAFWQNGGTDKKEMVDSLKALEKEFPDSVLLLADICLDVDSVAWKSSIKRDSLEVTKRFWAPMGMNDATVLKFKVPSLPFFIVFDKEGKQYYRGGVLSEAMEQFRQNRE